MKIQWLKPAMPQDPPYLCVFRNCFDLGETTRLDFRYSADERCVLYCDGVPVARGPERGTPQRWFTGRVEITLPPGEHILTAALYCFGPTMTAYGQMSVRHGFLPLSDNGVLTPHWEYQYAPGCCFLNTWNDWASYPHILTDEDFNWEIFSGRGGTWSEPETFCDERTLASPELPPMRQEEITNYQRCGSFFLFPEYVVVYGEYEFSGCGEVRLRWIEPGCNAEELDADFLALRKPGSVFRCLSGPGDRFRVAGQPVRWHDYHWHAGRTLEMTLFGDVKLKSVRFFRTGYPLPLRRDLEIPGNRPLSRLLQRSWRTLESCSAETTMDCPYYEQLQYIADTRLQALSIYSVSDDFRLIEKALRQFSEGQLDSGAMCCRYPSREAPDYRPQFGELYKIHIPAFTALWIQMVHDHAQLRCNDALTRTLLPSVRRAAAYLENCLGDDGVLHVPGWNFIDWVDQWPAGTPPGCRNGEGCTLDLIFVRSLLDLADLERVFGTEENRIHALNLAGALEKEIMRHYFIPERGCFAENRRRDHIAEHAQVWALLALGARSVIPTLEAGTLPECGIAFSFYYLAACRQFGLEELFRRRFDKYIETASSPKVRTMPELFLNNWWLRSDCHAWGTHALYWQFGTRSILDPIPMRPNEGKEGKDEMKFLISRRPAADSALIGAHQATPAAVRR